MKSKRGSAWIWIIIIVIIVLLILLSVYFIVPLFKTSPTYNLNVMLSAPLEGAVASINKDSISVDVRNSAPNTITINSFHLTFNSPSTAKCNNELREPLVLSPSNTLPVISEECEGFNLKEDTIDATVSISYTESGSSEIKTSTGKVWTSGPME